MNITKKDGAYNLIDTIFAPIKKNKEVLGMSSWFHKFISFFGDLLFSLLHACVILHNVKGART